MANIFDIGKDYKALALEKLEKESKEFKGNKYGVAVFTYVANALRDFCNQNETFAKVFYKTKRSFSDCVKEIMKGCGNAPMVTTRHLNDYYKMLEFFKVPITKQNRAPKDLKRQHDLLVERYNAVIHERRDEASKKALEYVNSWFSGYEKDGYCIVLPKSRADFIREGQALSHCVGSEHYYENHIAGTRMIFFIRKAIDKEKPFCTAEIDMTTFQVLQCYGFGDSVPPKEIKDFIKSFAKSAERTIKVKGALKDANERKAS